MLHGAFLARFGVAGWIGHVAEWLRSGLQIRAPRFDSGRGLQSLAQAFPTFPNLGGGHAGRRHLGALFRDLRGTAATRLSEGGCTPQEIATTTGHGLRDVAAILVRYLGRSEKIARTAIGKV